VHSRPLSHRRPFLLFIRSTTARASTVPRLAPEIRNQPIHAESIVLRPRARPAPPSVEIQGESHRRARPTVSAARYAGTASPSLPEPKSAAHLVPAEPACVVVRRWLGQRNRYFIRCLAGICPAAILVCISAVAPCASPVGATPSFGTARAAVPLFQRQPSSLGQVFEQPCFPPASRRAVPFPSGSARSAPRFRPSDHSVASTIVATQAAAKHPR